MKLGQSSTCRQLIHESALEHEILTLWFELSRGTAARRQPPKLFHETYRRLSEAIFKTSLVSL